MSSKYLSKPTHPGYVATEGKCDTCSKTFWESSAAYAKRSRHFCSQGCYTTYKKSMPPELTPRWTGGVSQTEAHRRWKAKNPERMAHLKAARYARERGATGSHTQAEWDALKAEHRNRCAFCYRRKPLTRDHIVPLSLGGTHRIQNIQPLCRSCNSRKWATPPIHQNPELLS